MLLKTNSRVNDFSQEDASLGVHGGLSVGSLSLNSLIGTERGQFSSSFRSLIHFLLLLLIVLALHLPRSVRPEAEEWARRRSATHTGVGKTRLPESRLSLLHSSRIGPVISPAICILN